MKSQDVAFAKGAVGFISSPHQQNGWLQHWSFCKGWKNLTFSAEENGVSDTIAYCLLSKLDQNMNKDKLRVVIEKYITILRSFEDHPDFYNYTKTVV